MSILNHKSSLHMSNMNINYCCVIWMAIKTASLCETGAHIIRLPPHALQKCPFACSSGRGGAWQKQITGSYFQAPYWSITMQHAVIIFED